MGICENQYSFVKKYGIDLLEINNKSMLELGDQILNSNQIFNGMKIAKHFYTKNGFNHTSIDWNGNNGSIKLDLTKPYPKFRNTFDIITNHGTSEHVHDQYSLFKNLHEWAKVGCIFVNCVPLDSEEHKKIMNYEFPPHGDFEYSSKFWEELCKEQDYELIISKGDLVRNPAVAFPINYYSASTYRKVNNKPFMLKEKFEKLTKFIKKTSYRLSRNEHIKWFNSLPDEIKNKYPNIS
tara:strand:- start:2275 stop:2985 length:711 start_codon:yes stop_codon:yes gene_type:complete